jgi:hypothetical protein
VYITPSQRSCSLILKQPCQVLQGQPVERVLPVPLGSLGRLVHLVLLGSLGRLVHLVQRGQRVRPVQLGPLGLTLDLPARLVLPGAPVRQVHRVRTARLDQPARPAQTARQGLLVLLGRKARKVPQV